MKQRAKSLAALLLALALSLSLALPVSATESGKPSLDQAAREAAAAAMTYGQAVQASWAVWQDGDVIAAGREGEPREDPGAGHLPALAAASQAADLYGAGSVSKIYTTVAVMQLAEAGKLDLDRPVAAYLPEFTMADERYRDITVRMLLNHSSGLMGSSMGSALLFEDASAVSAERLLERLSAQRLKADPGAYSTYCNDGFTLAQLVVERTADMNFQDYLRTHILAPAGLEETYFPDELVNGPERGRVVPAYQGEEARPLPMDCLGVVGTGGIYATAEDLAAFGGALTGEGLLKKASLEAMAAPEYAKGLWPEEGPDALSFGLGWDSVEWYPFSQNGITALVKGGDTQYYHAGLVVLPEYKLAAAVLSSGGVSTYNELAASQMLIAALRQRGVTVDETPLTLPESRRAPMPRELLDGAGWYGSLMVYKVDVSAGGTLTMSYPSMPQVPAQSFYYHADGSFRDENGASALRLVTEENGQTYLYQRAFTSLPGLGGLPAANYAAMKLPENKVDPALQESWDSLMGGAVLPMNERYSSQVYASMGALLQAEDGGAVKSAPGYVGTLRIEDGTRLRYAVQAPGNAGRDGSDMEIRRDEAGALWFFQSNGSVYMDMNAAPVLSAGKDGRAAFAIGSDGYARWYKIGGDAAGKTVTVELPEDAGFWAYNPDGSIAASSVLWGGDTVKLEEGGLIVFAGEPGAEFRLSFR